MTQQIILTRGVPASGKTTWALQYIKNNPQYVNVNRDDLRASMFPTHYNRDTYKPSKSRESAVTKAQLDITTAAIDSGKSVIVSDTNINPNSVANWQGQVDWYRQLGYDVDLEIKNFDCDLDVALERNALRDGGVPPSVVYRMYREYNEQVHPDWKVERLKGVPSAIIVDVDGTLANHEGVRNVYDVTKVHLDTPHSDIIQLVRQLRLDHKVVIMTGRDGSAEQATRTWLKDHKVPFDELYIRAAGDTRKDSVIKRELFDKHVRGKYNVEYVIDDRLQVIYMWRSLGLRVLDVAGGEF